MLNTYTRKKLLQIHILLGASDFAKIKTGTCPRVGQIGEPFSEPTKMDWIVMASDRKSGIVSALFHKKLCGTDVLGLKIITNMMTTIDNLKGPKKVGMKQDR